MGGCFSSPPKKHFKRPRSQPSVLSSSNGTVRGRSSTTFVRPTNVLNNPSEGSLFDRYELGNELGRGEFGITHRCTDHKTGEILACKTISKSKLRTEIDVEDVRREVEIMRRLPPHPNIVRFREAYEDKEAVHLVMELCEGGELFDRIVARGHYTERAAANVIKIIIEIVQVCHRHGVIHRDLKPENFLFANASESSDIKAIDFGLSIFFEPGQRFNEIVGSPYYMAPEVLRRNYGPEVDVWSAGVILYILLCGVPPFWAETEEGIAHAIVESVLDLEKDPWPKVSQEAKDLVKGMLDPNPYSRLTVEEVLDHSWIRNANKSPTIPLGENVRTRIKQFFLMNKFKKRVLRVVADNLPDEQIDVIKEMFYQMDTDKNGNITFDELKHGLQKIGHPVPDPDIRMLLDAADMDGNGVLNCEEFVAMSVHMRKLSSDDEHLTQAFNYFDKNKNGYIEFEELREALLDENLGPNNEQVVRDIMNDIDMDKDGRISYEEFKTMMKAALNWKMASRQYSRAMLKALSLKMFKDKY